MDVYADVYAENDRALSAQDDFKHAYRRAKRATMLATLTGRHNEMPSFEEIVRSFRLENIHYLGLRQVCVAEIAGSVGRNHDFDAHFNPIEVHTRARWERIDRAIAAGEPLPPVELYKVGDRYFVKDGNHRVSVAKHRKIDYIDAEVIEYRGTECIAARDAS